VTLSEPKSILFLLGRDDYRLHLLGYSVLLICCRLWKFFREAGSLLTQQAQRINRERAWRGNPRGLEAQQSELSKLGFDPWGKHFQEWSAELQIPRLRSG
jgi:hypothetical protein